MPVVEVLLAIPMLVWGGMIWTWLQTRSAAVKFWTVAGGAILSVVPVVVVAALDQGTREFVHGLFQ